MTFYQNPFTQEFRGNLLLDDRAFVPVFACPPNKGRSAEIVNAWAEPSGNSNSFRVYDLSGNDAESDAHNTLNLSFAKKFNNFLDWHNLSIDITDNTNAGLTPTPTDSAMKVEEIVAILNADPLFQTFFTASIEAFPNRAIKDRLVIKQKLPQEEFRFYIKNNQAEEVLKFNDRAGVAELPSYFGRHTIGNRTFTDSLNMLVSLDVANAVDQNVIDNAKDYQGNLLNYAYGSAKDDWQLLEGRSTIFMFTNVVSGTETITYPAGAKVGDLAKKTLVNGSDTFIVPHVLQSGDLITPP